MYLFCKRARENFRHKANAIAVYFARSTNREGFSACVVYFGVHFSYCSTLSPVTHIKPFYSVCLDVTLLIIMQQTWCDTIFPLWRFSSVRIKACFQHGSPFGVVSRSLSLSPSLSTLFCFRVYYCLRSLSIKARNMSEQQHLKRM